MIEKLQRRFALSRKGAMDVIKGSLFSALQNISFMLPVSFLYCLVRDMFNNELTSSPSLQPMLKRVSAVFHLRKSLGRFLFLSSARKTLRI